MRMSELSGIETKRQEAGSIVQQFICRAPKKNHQALVQLAKEFTDMFRNQGGIRTEYFQLSNTDDMSDFINMAKLSHPLNLQRRKRFGMSKYSLWIANRKMNIWQNV